MEENIFKMPKKQWKKWNELERKIFNDLNEFMLNNQAIFSHPDAAIVEDECWGTTAWNAAWTAAEIAREYRRHG